MNTNLLKIVEGTSDHFGADNVLECLIFNLKKTWSNGSIPWEDTIYAKIEVILNAYSTNQIG